MTSTTAAFVFGDHVTLIGRRACPFHGLCDDATCASCGRQTYDMNDDVDRSDMKSLRKVHRARRIPWFVACVVVAGVLPTFLVGLAAGSVVLAFHSIPAAAGAGVYKLLERLFVPRAVREL